MAVERRVVPPRVCPGRRRRVSRRSRNAKNRRTPSKMLTWPGPLARVGEPRWGRIMERSDAETAFRKVSLGAREF